MRDAAYHGEILLMNELLEKSPWLLETVDKKGHTPLMFACMGQQVDAACYLLERGAFFGTSTFYGRTTSSFLTSSEKRNKVTVFAYKVSPEGRARAAKELSRRKLEAKEAALDGTVSIMADLRDIIIARELKLRTRALTY